MSNNRLLLLAFIFLAFTLPFCCQSVKYPYGERLFAVHCADCHMDDGSGLSSLYPTLVSQKITSNYRDIPCIIKNGVNDTTSIIQMLPMPNVSDVEIANIVNYILNDMNNSDSTVTLMQINNILNHCKDSQSK